MAVSSVASNATAALATAATVVTAAAELQLLLLLLFLPLLLLLVTGHDDLDELVCLLALFLNTRKQVCMIHNVVGLITDIF